MALLSIWLIWSFVGVFRSALRYVTVGGDKWRGIGAPLLASLLIVLVVTDTVKGPALLERI